MSLIGSGLLGLWALGSGFGVINYLPLYYFGIIEPNQGYFRGQPSGGSIEGGVEGKPMRLRV